MIHIYTALLLSVPTIFPLIQNISYQENILKIFDIKSYQELEDQVISLALFQKKVPVGFNEDRIKKIEEKNKNLLENLDKIENHKDRRTNAEKYFIYSHDYFLIHSYVLDLNKDFFSIFYDMIQSEIDKHYKNETKNKSQIVNEFTLEEEKKLIKLLEKFNKIFLGEKDKITNMLRKFKNEIVNVIAELKESIKNDKNFSDLEKWVHLCVCRHEEEKVERSRTFTVYGFKKWAIKEVKNHIKFFIGGKENVKERIAEINENFNGRIEENSIKEIENKNKMVIDEEIKTEKNKQKEDKESENFEDKVDENITKNKNFSSNLLKFFEIFVIICGVVILFLIIWVNCKKEKEEF